MPKYETIFANQEYIIVNKPAGLLAHSAPHIREDSLAEQLLADYPDIKKIGEDPFRPGIIHRLDKQASGLMVIARTQASFDNLKSQFKRRTINKIYTALVHGAIEKPENEIDFPIARSAKGYKMAALPPTVKNAKNEKGRAAKSEFNVIKKYISYTLLKVKIKTGRTHQIRVHMSAYGHPVVGDDLYGTKKSKIKNKKLDLKRLFLTATELSFRDLSDNQQTYKIELPAELKNFLAIIK